MPPVLPGDVKQFHLPIGEPPPKDAQLEMFPWVLGVANVVYILDKHAGTEHTEAVHLLAQPPAAGHPTAWEAARPLAGAVPEAAAPPANAHWFGVPESMDTGRKLKALEKAFAEHLYATHKLSLWENRTLGLLSRPGETQADFRKRCRAARRRAEKTGSGDGKSQVSAEIRLARLELAGRKAGEEIGGGGGRRPEAGGEAAKVGDRLPVEGGGDHREVEAGRRGGGGHSGQPRKADVHVTHFGLAWAPYWHVGPATPTPAYR